MPSIRCQDVGVFPNDGFEMKADTREELMQHVQLHAKVAHGLQSIPPDAMKKVEAAIRTEQIPVP
jgi:predicted small metal-binding protein